MFVEDRQAYNCSELFRLQYREWKLTWGQEGPLEKEREDKDPTSHSALVGYVTLGKILALSGPQLTAWYNEWQQ